MRLGSYSSDVWDNDSCRSSLSYRVYVTQYRNGTQFNVHLARKAVYGDYRRMVPEIGPLDKGVTRRLGHYPIQTWTLGARDIGCGVRRLKTLRRRVCLWVAVKGESIQLLQSWHYSSCIPRTIYRCQVSCRSASHRCFINNRLTSIISTRFALKWQGLLDCSVLYLQLTQKQTRTIFVFC